jgi:hypothetical protein
MSRKPRMERVKNEHIKEIMGVKGSRISQRSQTRKDYSGLATSEGCQRKEYQN